MTIVMEDAATTRSVCQSGKGSIRRSATTMAATPNTTATTTGATRSRSWRRSTNVSTSTDTTIPLEDGRQFCTPLTNNSSDKLFDVWDNNLINCSLFPFKKCWIFYFNNISNNNLLLVLALAYNNWVALINLGFRKSQCFYHACIQSRRIVLLARLFI